MQDPAIQKATFGRRLEGSTDRVAGFALSRIEITDPGVIAASGLTHYPVLTQGSGVVPGIVYRITEDELEAADRYEGEDYRRILTTTALGAGAWVYVAA